MAIVIHANGTIFCLDENGKRIWSHDTGLRGNAAYAHQLFSGDADNDGLDEILVNMQKKTSALRGDGKLLWEDNTQEYHSDFTHMADVDEDGRMEFIYDHSGDSSEKGPVYIVDALTGQRKVEIDYHAQGLRHAQQAVIGKFDSSRKGLQLALCGKMGKIFLWDATSGELLWARDCPATALSKGDWNGDGHDEIMVFGLGVNVDGIFSVWNGKGERSYAISFLPSPYNYFPPSQQTRKDNEHYKMHDGGTWRAHAMSGGHEGSHRQVDLDGNGRADVIMPFGEWHWGSDSILFLMEGTQEGPQKSGKSTTHVQGADLTEWGLECSWTRYRLADENGTLKRLLRLSGRVEKVKEMRLYSPRGDLLDTEPFVEGGGVPLTSDRCFGFWIPENLISETGTFGVEQTDNLGGCKKAVFSPGKPPAGDKFPLRLDRTGEWLRHHLLEREKLPEAKQLAAFVPDMDEYLAQHRIVYEKPAEFWSEGLILGNGVVGALVAGRQGERQTFYLDRCDLWGAMPDGRPMGRFFGATLQLNYSVGETQYHQELLLNKARVETRDGKLRTTAWVYADRDVAAVECLWEGKEPLRLEVELSRPTIPMPMDDPNYGYGNGNSISQINGNWNPTGKVSDALRSLAEKAPHSKLDLILRNRMAVLRHELPNMSCAIGATIVGKDADWQQASEGGTCRVKASLDLKPGDRFVILNAVTSDRQGTDPVEAACALLTETGTRIEEARTAHEAWWTAYWKRSFVEMPDKLMENQWYFGAYHQASFARGLQAPSFFGLWHPLDWRCWLDEYTADVQPPMLFWGAFATNHLELLLPSHNTYGRLLAEYLKHSPQGASVPGHGYPDYAGGHVSFGLLGQCGVTAWLSQNFYDDFRSTGDAEFLQCVTYPMLAAFCDYTAGNLELGADGYYHCRDKSPEQNDTSPDNTFSRANIERCLRSAIEAAEFLADDPERVAPWKNILDHLYPYPVDGTTVCETTLNRHPYRCHASVLYPVFPARTIEPGNPLWPKMSGTLDVVTNLIGHNPYGRHRTIPGHEGGIEPMAFNSAFLLPSAARLRGWNEFERLYYALVPRLQLKRNGQMSIADVRHRPDMVHMSICEGVSGLEVGLTDTLLQQYSDHVRLFSAANPSGVSRFAGLRAFGGFELAGEYAGGETRFVTVCSLKGNVLRLMSPWQGRKVRIEPAAEAGMIRLADGKEGLDLPTQAGVTYRLTAEGPGGTPLPSPVIERRDGPREIRIRDGSDFNPMIVYFPTDRLFAQFSKGDRVYLGMPREERSETLPVDMDCVRKFMRSESWQERQTAARWLWHPGTEESRGLLKELENDRDAVVRLSARGGEVEKKPQLVK